MTNDRNLSQADVMEWYDLRWQIELFFKELKSTLGFAQYRFRRFDKVESLPEMTLVTFLYLECYRVRKLTRSSLSKEEKERWRYQRTYGLCLAMRRETGRADLDYLTDSLQTKAAFAVFRDNSTPPPKPNTAWRCKISQLQNAQAGESG